MDPMTPWLLLTIAALIVGCVSLYCQLRQVESQSLGRQSVIADELRDAEAALLSALEKLEQMDLALAGRERHLATENTRAGATLGAGESWLSQAAELARTGMTAPQIARELALPVGQVELALSLEGGGRCSQA